MEIAKPTANNETFREKFRWYKGGKDTTSQTHRDLIGILHPQLAAESFTRNTDLAIENGRSAANIPAIAPIGTRLQIAAPHGDRFGLIV